MQTTSLGLKKPDGDDIIDIQDFNDNADIIDEELAKRPFKTGDASNMTNTFSQAASLTNLTSREKQKTSFSKIMKAIADYISHKATIATASVSGHVLVTDTFSTRLTGGGASEGRGTVPSQWALADAYNNLKDDVGKIDSNFTFLKNRVPYFNLLTMGQQQVVAGQVNAQIHYLGTTIPSDNYSVIMIIKTANPQLFKHSIEKDRSYFYTYIYSTTYTGIVPYDILVVSKQ